VEYRDEGAVQVDGRHRGRGLEGADPEEAAVAAIAI
jgi:hypothetical protein